MATRPFARPVVALLGLALGAAAGCVPPTGPASDRPGGTDRPEDLPEPPRATFAISGSPTDPSADLGLPEDGAYDLWLWLLCSEAGVRSVEAAVVVTGDSLAEHWFSPDSSNVLITGTDALDLVVGGCPTGERRLGAIHLHGLGDGASVALALDTPHGGFQVCDADGVSTPFAWRGWSSDGSDPPHGGDDAGCLVADDAGGTT